MTPHLKLAIFFEKQALCDYTLRFEGFGMLLESCVAMRVNH